MRLVLGFAVLALAASAPPRIVSLTPSSAPATTLAITIEGAGFDPAASAPEVCRPDGVLVAKASVTERSPGRIAATVALAGISPGAYTVRVLNPDGTRSNAATLSLVGEVNISPASGRPGTPFTYSGRGFTGRSGVTSHLQGPDGLEWQAKRIGTSLEGTFEQTIVSGEFVPGTYAVWAMDDRTKITSPRFTFQVVGPTPAAPGRLSP
jgi:hypothetical protein